MIQGLGWLFRATAKEKTSTVTERQVRTGEKQLTVIEKQVRAAEKEIAVVEWQVRAACTCLVMS